jgi:hypothetical protein
MADGHVRALQRRANALAGFWVCVFAATAASLYATSAEAFPLGEFYRGVRAMGMGNAYTAIANDEDAMFYNPAGLAFNQSVKMILAQNRFGVGADPISDFSDFEAFASDGISADNVEKLFGKNFSGEFSIYPSLYLPNFGIGYYVGGAFNATARNLALPRINIDYYIDRGIVTGFGIENSLFKGHYLRMGLTGKWLQRLGYRGTLPLTALVSGNTDYVKSLASGSESGFGLTPGIQYELPVTNTTEVIFASAWHDIGDTRFGNRRMANRPPPIRNNLAAGLALIKRFGLAASSSNIKFAFEGRHLAEPDIDPRLKVHAGAELEFGIFRIQGGLNQVSLTAGAGIDLGFFQINAATYGVEQQALAFTERERRYVGQLIIRFDMLGRDAHTLRDQERRKRPRRGRS